MPMKQSKKIIRNRIRKGRIQYQRMYNPKEGELNKLAIGPKKNTSGKKVIKDKIRYKAKLIMNAIKNKVKKKEKLTEKEQIKHTKYLKKLKKKNKGK